MADFKATMRQNYGMNEREIKSQGFKNTVASIRDNPQYIPGVWENPDYVRLRGYYNDRPVMVAGPRLAGILGALPAGPLDNATMARVLKYLGEPTGRDLGARLRHAPTVFPGDFDKTYYSTKVNSLGSQPIKTVDDLIYTAGYGVPNPEFYYDRDNPKNNPDPRALMPRVPDAATLKLLGLTGN